MTSGRCTTLTYGGSGRCREPISVDGGRRAYVGAGVDRGRGRRRSRNAVADGVVDDVREVSRGRGYGRDNDEP